MTLEDAISMEPVKEKLRNLGKYMPGAEEVVCRFGSYLADKLNDELVPVGFNLAAQLAVSDIACGGDYGTLGKVNVPGGLVGYPPQIYALLKMMIPDIAEATCPPEFAKKVKEVIEKVRKMT